MSETVRTKKMYHTSTDICACLSSSYFACIILCCFASITICPIVNYRRIVTCHKKTHHVFRSPFRAIDDQSTETFIVRAYFARQVLVPQFYRPVIAENFTRQPACIGVAKVRRGDGPKFARIANSLDDNGKVLSTLCSSIIYANLRRFREAKHW